MREYRAWDLKEEKIRFYAGIFNKQPFTETSTFPQYESCPKMHDMIIEESTEKTDQNGIIIFVNDICTAYYDRQYIEGPIVYKDCSYWIYWEDQYIWLGSDTVSQVEVIGNIHEPV